MLLQDSLAGCGPAALANAAEALGLSLDQQKIAKLAKTDGTHGTQPNQLISAARKFGLSCHEFQIGTAHFAWVTLKGLLSSGFPVILTVNVNAPEDHYVVAVGMLGEAVIIVDSAASGLLVLRNYKRMMEWWLGGTKKEPSFYGIVVARKVLKP